MLRSINHSVNARLNLLLMKILKLNRFAGLAFALVALSALSVSAEVSSKAIEKSLTGIRAPELPAKAASLVVKATAIDQTATTIAVVKAAIAANPTSAAAVVGAISKAAPKMASIAAATAVSLEPKQAAAIARAATGAAPTEAEKIVAAMSKAAPEFSAVITQAAYTTVAAKTTAGDASGFQKAPTIGAPFVPRPGGTGEISRTNTVVVPPGDRDYSAP